MAGNPWQKTTLVFLIGMGVGAALGVLYAMKSADETSSAIAGSVKDGVATALAQSNRAARRAKRTFEDAKEQVQDAAAAGGEAYSQAKTAAS